MNRFRLPASSAYLDRPRLMQRLPDSPGSLVWLEAAYGYGKSVLASQWASALEAAGWRVVWVAMLDEPMRETIAGALGLPGQAPWAVLLEALWSSPTMLVIEDMQGDETIGPLLKSNNGLILLSSRGALSDPELIRIQSAQRLLRITAADLAFTREEARLVLGEHDTTGQAWLACQGWPLLLHLARLTGQAPEPVALVRGIRESLAPDAWQEALFLSALPFLPDEAGTATTQAVADAGFAQRLADGFRMHPAVSEALHGACVAEVREAVRQQSHRLDWLARGRACASLGLGEDLGELLESRSDLGQMAPNDILRWDTIAPPDRGPARLTNVGLAHCALRAIDFGIDCLLQAARDPRAQPDDALIAFKSVVWELAGPQPQRARELVAQAQPVFERASRDTQARFLNDASRIDYEHGAYEAADAAVRRALALLPADSPRRFPFQINLGLLRWNSLGDLESYIALTAEALERAPEMFRRYVARAHYNCAQNARLLSRHDTVRVHFRRAVETADDYPWVRTGAQAMLALVDGRLADVAESVGQLTRWEFGEIEYLVRAHWAQALLARGDVDGAHRALESMPLASRDDSESCTSWLVSRALVQAARGDRDGARRVFLEHPKPSARPAAVFWLAAHFRLEHDPDSLQALLELSTSGPAILPALVPLDDLPRGRPELATAYPLEDVLASGWREAVQLRLDEIAPLRVSLLGKVSVYHLGRPLKLGLRARQILALMALGWTRQAITDALWPEAQADAARNNFHVNLSQLRKQLEPWGVSVYLLEDGLAHTEIDLVDLERALQAGDADTTVALYRGELLPDLDLPELGIQRESLRRRVLALLRATAAQATGVRAEHWFEACLSIDPFDEDACTRLIRAQAARGQRAGALARQRAFASRLVAELGVQPSPEFVQLGEALATPAGRQRTGPV